PDQTLLDLSVPRDRLPCSALSFPAWAPPSGSYNRTPSSAPKSPGSDNALSIWLPFLFPRTYAARSARSFCVAASLLFLNRCATFLAGAMALPIFQHLMSRTSWFAAVRAEHHYV